MVIGREYFELNEAVRTRELIKEAEGHKADLDQVMSAAKALDNCPSPKLATMEMFTEGINAKSLIPEKVAEVRKPVNLSYIVSDRLLKEGITQHNWENAEYSERTAMLKKSFDIMLDEMVLPEGLRGKVAFEVAELDENTDANCYDLLRLDNDRLVANTNLLQTPRVEITDRLLDQENLVTALRGVFHEAVITMEHAVALESPAYFSDPDKAGQIVGEIRKTFDGIVGSSESAMQTYARNADRMFGNIYTACEKAKATMGKQISFK